MDFDGLVSETSRQVNTLIGGMKAALIIAESEFAKKGEASAGAPGVAFMRREIDRPDTVKFALSNAKADTSLHQLASMQAARFWIEHAFRPAPGSDYVTAVAREQSSQTFPEPEARGGGNPGSAICPY